jgi:alkylation response protein AidB-like acyl-CoA dehydrogenase
MDFSFNPKQEALLREIGEFLETESKEGNFEPFMDLFKDGYSPAHSRKIGEKGWIGLTWPKKYGGRDLGCTDRLIYGEEMFKAGYPVGAHWMAQRQVGPALIQFADDGQKEAFLPGILKGEIFFSLGFSEREIGSDLASLNTRAVRDRDAYIVNGHKIWVGQAHRSHYMWLLARTDPDVPKHKGLSQFLVDLSLPGITVHPIVDLTGMTQYNEVLFDDVRVPRSMLVGDENAGWYQIVSQLDYERCDLDRLMSCYPLYKNIVRYCRETMGEGEPLCKDPYIQKRLVDLETAFNVGRLLTYRTASLLDAGMTASVETAAAKVFCSEFQQRMVNFAMEVLGPYGPLLPGSKWSLLGGSAAFLYLHSACFTIQGGTSEIMRNIIATRGLGLPRA